MRDEIERSFRVSDLSLLSKLKKDLIPTWRIETIDLEIVTIEQKVSPSSVITAFEDSLRELWKTLKSEGIEIAMLMFDDLHYLAQKFPDGLYDLRGAFQRLPRDGCNFMLIITGYEILFTKAREIAEPFTRFFDRHTLQLFNEEETEQAIITPIKEAGLDLAISKGCIDKIYALTRGHPYFISFIMQDLVSLREKGEITLDFFNANYPTITNHLVRNRFAGDLSLVSEVERKILFKMAELPEVIKPSEIKIKNVRTYLKDLVENKELVIKRNRGEYSLYHPLFREYLRTSI